MGKGSGAEAAHMLDPHGGNQGDGTAASASREIFQGLFKDLGKQAMAMESILRLVCGKVDKLEHWVTEMSFGMTELDLQLRNIAHNIEGTAANVDDVPSASRWAVPQEQDDVPTATVVKKVGVGLHKKRQMRMTGMVANILDQLTAVAETPATAAVESESESHKGDDKKKTKAKAKKAKAGAVTSTSGVLLPPSASSAATTPRASETTDKPKTSKKKATHKQHADAKIKEEPATVATEVDAEDSSEKPPVRSESAVVAEDLRSALEDHIEQRPAPMSPPNETDETRQRQSDDEPIVVPTGETTPAGQPSDEETTDEVAPATNTSVEAEHVVEDQRRIDIAVQEKEEEIAKGNVGSLNAQEAPPVHAVELTQPAVENTDIPVQETAATVAAATTREAQEEKVATAPAPASNDDPLAIPVVVAFAPVDVSREEIDNATETQSREQDQHAEAPAAELPATDKPPSDRDQPSVTTTATTRTFSELPHPREDPIMVAPTLIAEVQIPPTNAADTRDALAVERPASVGPAGASALLLQDGNVVASSPPAIKPTAQLEESVAQLKKSPSKRLRRGNSGSANDNAQPTSPTKKGSRRASIRKSITQRQTSIKRRQMQEQPLEEDPHSLQGVHAPQAGLEHTEMPIIATRQRADRPEHAPTSVNTTVVERKEQHHHNATEIRHAAPPKAEEDDDSDEDDGDDDDDDEDDSSLLGSDSDESVLDLNERSASPSSSKTLATAAEKKMSMKMTRTLSALNKLKKAQVLTPEEIAELKQRANQKWFKLRDHVKEKNKKDVANILLKRKKNIFTVSNRIELLEEKSREVYASIKQLNTELKGKVDSSTFEGLRRHVHDIHVSLQVLDDKISKGNTPAMDHIKQLAKDTEAMRLFFLEQLELARNHCDGNHRETVTLFDEQWQRVLEIEKNIRDKLTALVAEYDDKLHDLPDYTDALEGIRRAIRKKADVKALRELEARLLGHDAEAEDCLVRCLSCHKEVVNAGHEIAHPQDDTDAGAVGSPHFKRVNPGPSSARVYRSNMPLNAQPIGLPDTSFDLFSQPQSEDPVSSCQSAVGSNSKSLTPSRTRNNEPKPSPLSFIHVTATRATSVNADGSRPISAPASAVKKKPQPRSSVQ